MLQTITVEESTLELLKKIQEIPLFHSFRLVGGTALALQIGHRFSIDLDFFGKHNFETLQIMNSLETDFFQVVLKYDKRVIKVLEINGVKVDIVNYPYEWIEPPVETEGVRMAGLKDIAAMKLSAITNRGTKKDFMDIYFLLQMFSLEEMCTFYTQKYRDGSLFNVIRSLSYFEDAESDPMPKLFQKVDWLTVKSTIQECIRSFK
ncbi:putative nucleotidyltransferase component of viral defense system [Parabacteroides sp. PFB2-10]|uniref:nucleotidyl transferase AbiEii/AbiGii toxin family protein n=1 Tax=Parabacteroides sp. PFB2-10 TaxID=1742405 RepID=UPI002473C3FD|nr:nucleotidyl transferase AbiEii/AbiGii toxin family protein [Parabacteroides sp. PFB2-10]MDH6312742.1 putative nucleotidyltransferase component of viral defense system [Parabacteroides sp. PFB2-10]MDL2245624.1 nucleotidyl transferase AbiEii/AbiGii toxin family protein [Parabacteroides sp. OttesenSCG-928-J18]